MSRRSRPQRRWIHCTSVCHGERWTAKRKVPKNCGKSEPSTPRLCVAPTVAGCLAARLFKGDVWVYLTEPRRSIKPVEVWDAPITGERWIVPPVHLDLACVLPAEIVRRASERTHQFVKWRKCASPQCRLMGMVDAINALRDQPRVPGVQWFNRMDELAASLFDPKKLEPLHETPSELVDMWCVEGEP